MKPLTVQGKVALWSVLAMAAALVLFAVGTLINLYFEQLKAIDLEMDAEAKMLVALPEISDGEKAPVAIDFHPWMAYAILRADGGAEYISARLESEAARSAVGAEDAFRYSSAKGKWRLRSYAGDHGQVVVVGFDLAEMRDVIEDLLISYAVSFPFVLAAAAWGGRWIARRALRPVRELAYAAGHVEPGRLDVRVPVPAADDEVQQLARALNTMLARLETAFVQAQRFASDASHELRTPLTIMRSEIERLLRPAENGPSTEERLLSLQLEVSRLDRITEHLLLLARYDAGQVHPPHTLVNFSALVAEAVEDAELIAATQKVELRCEATEGIQVEGDESMLRRLVLNLLDNAVRHNVEGGCAVCHLERREKQVLFRVRNTGPGIAAVARPALFTRFFRADPARGSGGHGLGLALCREIALTHRGDVEHVPAEGGWTEFVLRLPGSGMVDD